MPDEKSKEWNVKYLFTIDAHVTSDTIKANKGKDYRKQLVTMT